VTLGNYAEWALRLIWNEKRPSWRLANLAHHLISNCNTSCPSARSRNRGYAQRVEIAAGINRAIHAAGLFGRHVGEGTEHTFHFVGRTAVHGGEMTGEVAKESFHGLREGSDVVVHYSAKGSEETAEEIDHIGKGGLKASEGTVTHLDRGAKTVTIKTADGGENVFRLTDHAAEDAGKDISEGAEKSAKVTVYYTEQAGHKVAHFFSR
jgi:hypothetical protein